ncbi:UDP-glucuronic acid decarboxylase family protein [Amycolatopsis anabasis]|uniref:UDP-glucuronic acid decarboxylase family protein n=1 Tax=Amycolatopsis anabasis TaxID=1840409 RepID=UPI00131CF1E9|nr:UDP-glucuronic acid decarboxylase family protein [Amycolatopsis anabasis]
MAQHFERAVVTGGAGFVGSHLCARLLEDGTEVLCADNLATGVLDNIRHLLSHERFRFRQADVTTALTVKGGVDAVFHLACPASPRDYLRLPIETLRVGSRGTEHALDLADRKGARFLLASTSEVYGDPREHPQRETYWGHVNPVGPRSVYDEAKRYAEALTSAYRTTRGTDTTIARIFNTYGPRMRSTDGRMIPTFIHQALAGEPITVTGDGEQTRSVCFVDDTVAGLLALAHGDHPGPVNLGNPHERTVGELAREIRRLTGSSSEIRYLPAPVDDPKRRCPDISLARAELGWRPRVSLADGLNRTIGWFATEATSGEPLRKVAE